jgi:hypothetical protein
MKRVYYIAYRYFLDNTIHHALFYTDKTGDIIDTLKEAIDNENIKILKAYPINSEIIELDYIPNTRKLISSIKALNEALGEIPNLKNKANTSIHEPREDTYHYERPCDPLRTA